jgi:pimeloyl-ACP methyl ester carboxylesterase
MTENFVLVPGAWHGGWAYQAVAAALRSRGHRVFAATSPGLGVNDDPAGLALDECVSALVADIDKLGTDGITLVGHSWGGYVIAGATPVVAARLRRVVFWSAFVPEAGRSLYDEVPPDYQQLFTQLAGASADNTVALPLPVFQGVFMNDADPATAGVVHAQLRPQPYRYFTDAPVNGTAYQDAGVPLSYVLSADDVSLPPGEYGWDRFAGRIGATPISTPGSHESLFTKPAELADALLVAAEVSFASPSS